MAINLNSASETDSPTFTFVDAADNASGIHIFTTICVRQTCLSIKSFLLYKCERVKDLLQLRGLDLHLLNQRTKGQIIFMEDAACLHGRPVTIMAVLMPRAPQVRWFYFSLSLIPVGALLSDLSKDPATRIKLAKNLHPRDGVRHHRVFLFMHEEFIRVITPPHSAKFLEVQRLVDYCLPIHDPKTAIRRLEARPTAVDTTFKDLSDDRYVHEVHPAERDAVSVAHCNCAEYLLLKRQYFTGFWHELNRTDWRLMTSVKPSTTTASPSKPRSEPGSTVPATPATSTAAPSANHSPGSGSNAGPRYRAVRSDTRHTEILSRLHHISTARARRLVVIWRELGFLDEAKYMEVINAGGNFDCVDEQSGEDDDDDD